MRAGMFLIALATALSLGAQPAFEVASVKVSTFRGNVGPRAENGRFIAQHMSVADLVVYAYDLEDFQVSGGPAWVYSADLFGNDRYEVQATVGGTPSAAQFRQMLQGLLKERFQVVMHRGTKGVPVYALTQNEGGAKLRASALGAGPSRWSSGRVESKYEAAAVSMETLSVMLRTPTGRPVVDRTGLSGTFAFTL